MAWNQLPGINDSQDSAFSGDFQKLLQQYLPAGFSDSQIDNAIQGATWYGKLGSGSNPYAAAIEVVNRLGTPMPEDQAQKTTWNQTAVDRSPEGVARANDDSDWFSSLLPIAGLALGGYGLLSGLGGLGAGAGALGAAEEAAMLGGSLATGTASEFSLFNPSTWSNPFSGLPAGATTAASALLKTTGGADAPWGVNPQGGNVSYDPFEGMQDWQAPTGGSGYDPFEGMQDWNTSELRNLSAGPPATNLQDLMTKLDTTPGGKALLNSLTGGGTDAAGKLSFLEQALKAGSSASQIAKMLGVGEGTVGLLGKLLGFGASAIGASQQGDEFRRLSDEFKGYGAPSRARYEGSFQPGFTMQNDPGYKDALDQTTKSFLHKASIAGNPADSPNAWKQTLSDVNSSFAYPALQNYRTMNANTGGYSSFNTAAPQVATQAAGSGGNVWNAVGAGVSDIFNPKRSLAEEYADYKRLMGS